MAQLKILNTSKEKILKHFFNNEEIVFETYNLNNAEEQFLIEVLNICLEAIGKEKIFNYIRYCFKELLGNAKRANLKRIYFDKQNLNISDPIEYKNGMNNFTVELVDNIDYYSSLLNEYGLYLKISYKVEENFFIISIVNNSVILDDELNNAKEKIINARTFNTIEEAFDTVRRDNEGAGLGIIILVLMLKKIGLDRDTFRITRNSNETIACIRIPISFITYSQNEYISNLLVNEINSLPMFPEQLVILQNKLADPNVSLKEIIKHITFDPSLIAEILKFANSACFMQSKKINSILEAIKLIGIKRLKTLIYSYGTHQIFNQYYNITKMRDIWQKSYKVAYFALIIAKKYLQSEKWEEAYIAGLLHNIGKILLLKINPDLLYKITSLCIQKEIPVHIIEDITSGYNHAIVGALIARKWYFPDSLIAAIEFHNDPLKCTNEYNQLVYCVYLAIMMTHEQEHQQSYSQIETTILSFFNIYSFEDYEKWYNEINEMFNASDDEI